MKIQIELNKPAWLRLPRTRRGRSLAVMVVTALVVAVPVAWASHDFGDVPDGAPFHTEIAAIKRAGITTGCGGGNYCPTEFVRRDAMAAFMHRGYGRVARTASSAVVPTTETPAWTTFTITPGLPAGALPGSAGFIKTDATLTVELTNATGCPCQFRGALFLVGTGYMVPFYTDVTLATVGERKVLAMTGAAPVTTSGAKTIEVRIFRAVGSGAASAYGNATSLYVPFGSTGTNVLGVDSSARGENATE